MQVSFLAPGVAHPAGGVVSIHRFAESLAERGHEVRVVHVDFGGVGPAPREEIGRSVDLHGPVVHEFVSEFRGDLSGGDAVVCFDERIPTGAGRPFMWIQAIGVLGRDTERAIFGAACPKLCTSRWLARAALGLGNHPDQVHVVPYGLDHTRWRPTSALPDRTRDVALLHHPLLIKGTAAGLATIERARHSMPGLGVTLFGTAPLDTALPDWADFVHAPTPDQLRHQIYGDHRIYLLPAWVEGFGLTGIEAQACGTPLVVTANGGSADYATHGVDALVAQPGDVAGLAEHVLRLLDDTALAIRLADTARLRVRTFDWAASGAILERHLLDHLADPDLGSRDPVTDPSTRDIGPTIRALLSEFYADESSVPDPGQGTSREPSADR